MKTKLLIRNLLDAKGWSANHLAAALYDRGFEIHPITIQRWVDGKNEPRGVALTATIADIFECGVHDLFEVERVAS